MNEKKLEEIMSETYDETQVSMFIEFIKNEQRLDRESTSEIQIRQYIKKRISDYCENKANKL